MAAAKRKIAPRSEAIPIPEEISRDRLFVLVLTLGVLFFAVFALWDLIGYLRLGGYLTAVRQALPPAGASDPDRLILLRYLSLARGVYRESRFVVLGSLLFGGIVGMLVVFLLGRYLADRTDVEEGFWQVFFAMAEAVEDRDPGTGRHCRAVRGLSLVLGERLGLSRAELRQLALAAHLHDLGKIAVPDRVLLKPGPLDEEEWAVIRRHPRAGAEILGRVSRFAPAARAILHHHERLDGSGYPDGLKGPEIPLHSRIIAVADAYLALIHNRPYRHGVSVDDALAEIRRQAGRQFDPAVVEVFLRLAETGELSAPAA